MVAMPSFTSTFNAPPLTSLSPESLIRTWSLTAASLSGLSAAAAGPQIRTRIAIAAQILIIIAIGHCTPVQRIEKGRILAPTWLHLYVQFQIDLHSEDTLHLLTGQGPDLFEHRAAGPDHDPLLAFPLHPDGGEDS